MPPREKPASPPKLCIHRIPETSFCRKCATEKPTEKKTKGKRAG